ncbi:hypothetical protein THRCLA_09501 [Thraustotheca clavata]|uniref:Uncharacterized protein n=1 Tax=Thraustotheca clavata TaxID=74557 RepID=A0A1V9YW47_9STRA|nr:hypothetical protein THRCLA_09501 [Thraustotheca clavata]
MYAQPFGRGVRRSREEAMEVPFAHVNKRVKRTLADEMYKLRLQPVVQQPVQQLPEPVWYDQVSSPDTDHDEPMMDDVDMMGEDNEEEEKLQLVPYEKQPTGQSFTLTPVYQAAMKSAFVEDVAPTTSTAIVLYRPPRNVDWKTAPESDTSDEEDDASYQMMDIDDDL